VDGSTCKVDIILTVFNALSYVQQNLERLEQNSPEHGISFIIVNDGSAKAVSTWLVEFSKGRERCRLVEFLENKGYTNAINFGVRVSSSDYLVLMNSDVLLSVGWLDGMMKCMCADPQIGMVGPLSNAGGFQSVPKLFSIDGDFAVNEIPEGATVDEVSSAISNLSRGSCFPVTLLNGFLYLVKKSVFHTIGYFDDDNFPKGFGEEEDFCLRANAAGFLLVVTDSVYVYHFKSKSFGPTERVALLRQGRVANKEKHSRERFMPVLWQMSKLQSLCQLRTRVCTDVYDSIGC